MVQVSMGNDSDIRVCWCGDRVFDISTLIKELDSIVYHDVFIGVQEESAAADFA